MIIPFKRKTGDASSITSSRDSITEEKNRIANTAEKPNTVEASNTVEKSDLQFSVRVSSIVHSHENGCNGLIIAIHNPTHRCFAVLLNDWAYPKFDLAVRPSFRTDISANAVAGNPKYAATIRIRTLDTGWKCFCGRWNLFKDWKFRHSLLIINSGHTHYVSVVHDPDPGPGGVRLVAKQDPGPFKLKTYQLDMLMDFNSEQWNSPEFQACLSSPCCEFAKAARYPCGVCDLKSQLRRRVDEHFYQMVQLRG